MKTPTRAPKTSHAQAARPVRAFKQARARETYEELLRAAAAVFAERGYHYSPVREIAERAGVSVGTFYVYFNDKRSVFVELIHLVFEKNLVATREVLTRWEEPLAAGEGDTRAFVDELVGTWTAIHGVPSEALRMFLTMTYEDEDVAALSAAYDRREQRDLARFIAAVARPELRDAPEAAAAIIDKAAGGVLRWVASGARSRPAALRAALAELIHRYLFE